MNTSKNDVMLILSGWHKERAWLKAGLYSEDSTAVAVVFGLLHSLETGELMIHPDRGESDLAKAHLLFRLNRASGFEFEPADVVEKAVGMEPGDLSERHGETMVTIRFRDGSHVNLSDLRRRGA